MEERRRDYPDIVNRLTILEVMQQKDLDVAEDWRKRFCTKIDKLTDLVSTLPCDRREERWLSQGVQIKWMWGVLTFFATLEGVFIAALITHISK
jgi:hypothetical protein